MTTAAVETAQNSQSGTFLRYDRERELLLCCPRP
jgi:hypothetical protein